MEEKTPLPSWFANRGVSCGSKYGKMELEHLAQIYMIALARDGNYWHEVTIETANSLLTQEELEDVGCYLRMVSPEHSWRGHWWSMLVRDLSSAEGAFDVGGTRWNKNWWNREQAGEKI